MLQDDEPDQAPPLHPFHDHDPWQHTAHAPDPDEDDISNLTWQANGPNRMSFQFSRNISPTGAQPGYDPRDPRMAANPLLQSFATMLNGIVGGAAVPNAQAQPDPTQPGREGGYQSNTQRGGQDTQDGQPRAAGGAQFYHGGGPGFTWTASTRVMPGGFQAQTTDSFPMLFNQLFGPTAGGDPFTDARGNAGGLGPLGGFFAGLLNPANMQHGDAVYSQEALDRIISQLMEQNTSGNAPGPASAEAIANLPQKTIAESDLDEQGKADCSICMESVQIGEKVTALPCGHWFHGECIKMWLGEHDTCPHCRSGIMPRDGPSDATAPRTPGQAPMHESNWGEGTSTNPFTIPDSPTRERRASNSGSTGGGSLLGRMRNAFGGGSPGDPR